MSAKDNVHDVLRSEYGRAAHGERAPEALLGALGYDENAVNATDGVVSLGCGNPTALAGLRPGEVVLDLGSGAGFDALVAGPTLGPQGRFIGVDMTPDMLEKARTNAVGAGLARTVEFREGTIEDLPVSSDSVDVVISNCVVNLSVDKPKVMREAFRVLRSGGRLAITDLVVTQQLPAFVREAKASWVACIAGALTLEDYEAHLRAAGFVDVALEAKPVAGIVELALQDPLMAQMAKTLGPEQTGAIAGIVRSASITARKP